MKRITLPQLTKAQRAQVGPYAQMWIERALSCEPADLDTFREGARRCYEYIDVPWHDNVVLASSPIIMTLAAPAAAAIVEEFAADTGPRTHCKIGDLVETLASECFPSAAPDDIRARAASVVREASMPTLESATGSAKRVRERIERALRNRRVGDWSRYLGGCWWLSWQAYLSFFREVCGLQLEGDLWDRYDAFTLAQQSVGWWWPHERFIIATDRPKEIHRERVGPDGWGSHRLHCETGPAISWRDGWGVYVWHGFRVPAYVVEEPTLERIGNEPNVEVRRCAIESYGWDRFVADAALQLVNEAPDPGNPGQTLRLYDVPAALWGDNARLLVMTNGTPELDGHRPRYGEPVPASISDPVEASAWGWGVSVDEYRQLERRT